MARVASSLRLTLAGLAYALLARTLAADTAPSALDAPARHPSSAPASAPASRPAGGRPSAEFQPGVRIDWAAREILVDATVILRQGDIELFACSPKMREHEAIVRIEARPLHVYLALGLIGLKPGEPAYFDLETRTSHAAHGDPR